LKVGQSFGEPHLSEFGEKVVFESIHLPNAEAIGILHLLQFERASFLAGKSPATGININGIQLARILNGTLLTKDAGLSSKALA
jgi:hypothetical protein